MIKMERLPKEQGDHASSSSKSSQANKLERVEDKRGKVPNIDAELDITNEQFNPLKALYSTEYRVTEKQPKIIYQNMAAFESALKKVGISGLNKAPKNTEASGSKSNKTLLVEEKTERRFLANQMAIRTQPKIKSKHQRNLMVQMAQSQGPLEKLKHFVNEGRQVKVLIRREHGIKGYVEGVLKLFDRHWNLLLVDVMECLEHRKYKYAEDKLVTHQSPQDCTNILQNLGITLPTQSVKSLGRKRVEIKRHLPQIMLRGEHVVLISDKVTG